MNKLTTKLQEALQSAQQLALRSAHPELRSTHFLLALVQQEGGLVIPLVKKAGGDPVKLKAHAVAALESEPRVQGAFAQSKMSYDLRSVLDQADQIRDRMGDDYLSVEHTILGMLADDSPGGKLLIEAGLTRKELESALKKIRGSQTATDKDPEGKYQALEKYGEDLTAKQLACIDGPGDAAGRLLGVDPDMVWAEAGKHLPFP